MASRCSLGNRSRVQFQGRSGLFECQRFGGNLIKGIQGLSRFLVSFDPGLRLGASPVDNQIKVMTVGGGGL